MSASTRITIAYIRHTSASHIFSYVSGRHMITDRPGMENPVFFIAICPSLAKTNTQTFWKTLLKTSSFMYYQFEADDLIICLYVLRSEPGKTPENMYAPISDIPPPFYFKHEMLELITIPLQPNGDIFQGDMKISIFMSKRHCPKRF